MHNNFNDNDKHLDELFKQYSATEEKYNELIDELKILKDTGLSKDNKLSHGGKIKKFLKDNAVEIGGEVFRTLMTYINLLLG